VIARTKAHIMDEQQAAAHSLIKLARPFIVRQDRDGLAAKLRESWSADCLTLFLSSPNVEVVKTAAYCLGLIGCMDDSPALVELLGDDQPLISDTAEDALWSIWFRAGGPIGQAVLYRIARSIEQGETGTAAPMLTELIRSYPNFAEAHHQRAQAHYLNAEYPSALRDARRATDLNPSHFAAFSLLGHCHSVLGRYDDALHAYREALRIHPRMAGVRDSIQQVRSRILSTGSTPVTV
jgi:tetratricopeptide (TPR) repeat protein